MFGSLLSWLVEAFVLFITVPLKKEEEKKKQNPRFAIALAFVFLIRQMYKILRLILGRFRVR